MSNVFRDFVVVGLHDTCRQLCSPKDRNSFLQSCLQHGPKQSHPGPKCLTWVTNNLKILCCAIGLRLARKVLLLAVPAPAWTGAALERAEHPLLGNWAQIGFLNRICYCLQSQL